MQRGTMTRGPRRAGASLATQRALWNHIGRKRRRKPPTEEQAADAVAAYFARGGAVTLCPVASAAPMNQGDGLVPPATVKPQEKQGPPRTPTGQFSSGPTTQGTARKRRRGNWSFFK